jgi:hypothetical protein
MLDRFMAGYATPRSGRMRAMTPSRFTRTGWASRSTRRGAPATTSSPKRRSIPSASLDLDVIVNGAVALKYPQDILGDAQLTEVIQIPPRRRPDFMANVCCRAAFATPSESKRPI